MTRSACHDGKLTEEALRQGLNRGERPAREALFRAYGGRVRCIIRGRARHLTESELGDEVQEVFLAFFSRAVRIHSSIERYVVRATLNHCASRARHWAAAKRAGEILERLAMASEVAHVAPPSFSRHDLDLVRRFLDGDPEAREVYELMYVEGYGRPEIARRKNWPDRYARTRMRRLHDGLGAFFWGERRACPTTPAPVPAAAS